MAVRLALLVIAVAACGGRSRAVGTYPVPGAPAVLLDDADGFARFAAVLRHDLEAETGGDRAAHKARWFDLALLDGLDGDWAGATARLDAIVAEETTPTARWMTGLTIRAWIDASTGAADGSDAAFRTALTARIAAMPYPVVAEQLAFLQQLAVALTPALSHQLIAEHVGPDARDGSISRESASAVVFQRWVVLRIAPVATIIDEVVAAAASRRE